MIRHGNQEPTFKRVGEYSTSDGAQAIQAFEEMGYSFYPCQKYEMELLLSRNEQGSLASKTIAITKPRQNGKSYAVRFYLAWMAAVEGRNVLYTAHHGKTVRDFFKQCREMFETQPELYELLKPDNEGIYRAHGMEGIYLTNGGSIEFSVRTNQFGRGMSRSILVFDEAQEMTQEMLEAVQPTTIAAAGGDIQKIFLGTPPGVKCAGTVFADMHRRAHSDNPGDIWWLEWSAEHIPDPFNVDMWYLCNPAMGYRITEEAMADAASTMSPESFAQEYLNHWPRVEIARGVIPSTAWSKCETETPAKDGITCFAIKFSPDGAIGSMSVCVRPRDGVGLPHIELVESREMIYGLGWFVEFIESRYTGVEQFVIDGKSNAQALVDELRRHGIGAHKAGIIIPKTEEVTTACSLLLSAVCEGKLTHYGQDALTEAATKCSRRNIGSGGGWGFKSEGAADATVIESAALAYWATLTTKRDKSRKQRMSF